MGLPCGNAEGKFLRSCCGKAGERHEASCVCVCVCECTLLNSTMLFF